MTTKTKRRWREVVSELRWRVCDAPDGEEVDGIIASEGGRLPRMVRGPRDAVDHARRALGAEPRETMVALMLDARRCVIAIAIVSRGTLASTLANPREVFGPALRLNAAAIVLAHNHPSGDPTPSDDDRAVTLRMAEAGRVLGIPLVDHVVIGDPTAASGRWWSSLRDLCGVDS